MNKCFFCSGNLGEKQVTEIVRGGGNTATLKVKALVCQCCDERYYHTDVVRQFEEIKAKLKTQKTEDFKLVGQAFEIY
ncbi:conserved hypothetical protein [Gloeothece citriformis PCC 7424]|uniref:YgiT-type zinc finger domain-containing protein n=1 Tax=Gloeothece citriformis (strain PCC 7424) TaxID=65393 RepID=B7KCQ4_GLOC7|nr:YgiT-type zinc finger protein [Gloeothece citriformis]ACK71605.1 conserved hypothetical protein [Gloeothece citriformis PCC 7424]